MRYWTAIIGNSDWDTPARVARIQAAKRADADTVWNVARLLCEPGESVIEVKPE